MNPLEKAECVAVVGLGLLGRGIAACFLCHGFRVIGVDNSDEQHAVARAGLAQMIDEWVQHKGADASLRETWTQRYHPATSFDGLRECRFVVESVTEDLAIKERVFDGIEAVVSEDTVIASNTSAIPISRLQQGRQRPERFVGMHWAQPAHATRFMELIRGDQTSTEALETAATLARRLDKEPCLCQKDVPAFIVNRLGYAMYREALHLLQTGVADAETIDRAARNAIGLWSTLCGPLRWMDISGGPELYAKAMQRVLPTLSKEDEVPPVMQELVAGGARGTSNLRGFFQYTPEEAKQWAARYEEHAWRMAKLQDEYAARQSS